MKGIHLVILYIITPIFVTGSLSDYINGIGGYFGYNQETADDHIEHQIYDQKIPYEISVIDERFLNEAAKLTGVALSDLDRCQQRVVLRLKSDCDKMNDEQLAKMAVHLLNCQSFVEGRQIYPCTDEMSIKDCTTSMDSDTWTSYHLMSNRARAVCYSIRQIQFRGLAEHTVNRLMDAARDQLHTLGRLSSDQEKLKDIALTTYDSLTKGHESLSKQQKDLQKAQFHGQLIIEDNIKRLVDEKRLILETHNHLMDMTFNVQDKLEHSLKQLGDHSDESRSNHEELIEDLITIQTKVQEIFERIDESSSLLLKQNEYFREQYQSTMKSLIEVNETVHKLVFLLDGTRQLLEDKLSWITTALGGTDLTVERIYLILWHTAFTLLAMLTCAFLTARATTRLVVTTLPPLNLAVALHGEHEHLDPIRLAGAMAVFIFVQAFVSWAIGFKSVAKRALPWIKVRFTPKNETHIEDAPKCIGSSPKTTITSKNIYSKPIFNNSEILQSPIKENEDNEHEMDSFNDFDLTPPVSRNGDYPFKARSRSRSHTPLLLNTSQRGSCQAKTRIGTPCKLSSLPGRSYCYRHQGGDSVVG